ncbi:hypothetical protein [Streptomyces sp. NBC_01264]|uniref:hypothetical protein n=1 Tax=Streptomyces sp. NBC_01264 TaxID=2903804 RepID=UPI002253F1FD|nr:hypothetical protein [Streptomyces sp. NBC_01264]MCX4775449.1 hypothetical protein [Streptomyces sp. NBC_01264]
MLLLLGVSMRMPKSKVGLYAAIRRDHRPGGISMRALEHKYGVTWWTVRRSLDSQWPEPRKKHRPRTTRLDPYKRIIDGFLQVLLLAGRGQESVFIPQSHIPGRGGRGGLWGRAHRAGRGAHPLLSVPFGGNIIETGTGSCRLATTRAEQQAAG